MAESTNRCPICDENILMPFRKRLSETQFDHVVVCANQRCKATFRLLPRKVDAVDFLRPSGSTHQISCTPGVRRVAPDLADNSRQALSGLNSPAAAIAPCS
jgi:hypothetical protein